MTSTGTQSFISPSLCMPLEQDTKSGGPAKWGPAGDLMGYGAKWASGGVTPYPSPPLLP